MSWVIELRRADAVKQGDLVLAQWQGVLGPCRVTDASYQPEEHGMHQPLAVQLTLAPQGSRGPGIMQMHAEGQLVPLLVPTPEPAAEEEPLTDLRRRALWMEELRRIEAVIRPTSTGWHGTGNRARDELMMTRRDDLVALLGWLP